MIDIPAIYLLPAGPGHFEAQMKRNWKGNMERKYGKETERKYKRKGNGKKMERTWKGHLEEMENK